MDNFFLFLPFTDIVKEFNNEVDFTTVFQRLTEENFASLPNGGGIFAK